MDILTINLSSNDKIPLYEQLYNSLKREIEKGNIKSNTKLPSKRKLSKYLQISQNTIENAYEQLMAEGYIISKPKSGYYVCDLENIFTIGSQNKSKDKVNKRVNNIYKYEFLSSRIELELFPFSIWKKLMKATLSEENKSLLQIGHSQGDYNLRESISKYLYSSRGVVTTADNIVIGAGTEYLFQILINLIGRNKIYGMEDPGYFKIRKILNTHGINPRGISLDEYGLNIESLNKSLADVIHITPSHQFPLGTVMPVNRRSNLLKWASEKEGRYIIEDDYDSEFRFSGKPVPSLQSLDRSGKVIYLGTFSKSLAPSLRIGYMVLPKELLEIYKESFSFYACTVSRFDQQTLNAFIEGGYFERHLNKMRNTYKRKRERLVTLIKENFNDVEIIGTNAGLHLLLKFKSGISEEVLINKAKKAGIKILGLSNCYEDKIGREKESTIFLGYAGLREEELEEAILILKDIWFREG